MLHVRRRRSVLEGRGRPVGTAETKRQVASRISRVQSAKEIVQSLPVRRVSRNSSAADLLKRSSVPERTKDINNNTNNNGGAPLVGKAKISDHAIEQARMKFFANIERRNQMAADMEAFRQREEQAEMDRKEKMKRLFELERMERREKLEQWKSEAFKKEQEELEKKKKKEEAERAAREEALKRRQKEYLQQLRAFEEQSRKKKTPRSSLAAKHGATIALKSNKSKKGFDPKQPLASMRSSYDPKGKSSSEDFKSSKQKFAKKLSDAQIVQMARNIVQQSHSTSPKKDRAFREEIELERDVDAEDIDSILETQPEKQQGEEDDGLISNIEEWYRQQLNSVP